MPALLLATTLASFLTFKITLCPPYSTTVSTMLPRAQISGFLVPVQLMCSGQVENSNFCRHKQHAYRLYGGC